MASLKETLSAVTKPASDQERGNQQPETSTPTRSQEPGASDANRFEEIDAEVKFKKFNSEDSFLGGDESTILDSSF